MVVSFKYYSLVGNLKIFLVHTVEKKVDKLRRALGRIDPFDLLNFGAAMDCCSWKMKESLGQGSEEQRTLVMQFTSLSPITQRGRMCQRQSWLWWDSKFRNLVLWLCVMNLRFISETQHLLLGGRWEAVFPLSSACSVSMWEGGRHSGRS